MWSKFREAYKTYMGASSLDSKVSDTAIGAQPRFSKSFMKTKGSSFSGHVQSVVRCY